MSRRKSVCLVLIFLASSLSGIAFSFDENDTGEGQFHSNPEELNLLQHQSMQNVQGILGGGGTSNDAGEGIATDSSGNAYVTGHFIGTATFGSTSLTSSGSDDVFIAKLSSSGSWQWAVKAGGSYSDKGYEITIDSSGNAYATGSFEGTATFGSTNLTSSGSIDIFIAKLSSSGSWQWAVKAGGSYSDRGNGIAVDSSGNAYATGYFAGTATFGSTSLTSSGGADIFIAKLSSSGSWQWVVKAGGSSNDFGQGIALDSSGNAYATGSFEGTVTFGSTSLTSSGSDDIFIAKLSSSGSWQWAVKAGGSSTDYGFGIAVDADGFVHLTGEFIGTGDFRGDSLTSAGGTDVFVWCTFPGPILTSVSPNDSHPDGNVTATITGDSFQWLNQTFSKNIAVTNSGSSTLNNHVITVEDPFYNESGLVGSWHFDDSGPTNPLLDSSGNDNNATEYGGIQYTVDGIDGLAIHLDGANDYLRVADDNELDFGTGEFSVSAWVKLDDLSIATMKIIRKGHTNCNSCLILQYDDDYGGSWMGYAGAQRIVLSSEQDGYEQEESEWTHVVFTRKINPSNYSLSLYLNGELKKIISATSAPVNITNTEDLSIGASLGSSGHYLQGSMDELKIYDRLITDAEILSQFQGGNAMRNYWDVRFSDSNGSALPHTLPADGEFQIKIPQIPANSSINISIEYGQHTLSNPNINTTDQSSDMTNISISIGSETSDLDVSFGNTSSSHVEYIDENMINVTVPAHSIGIVNLTITDASGYNTTHDFTYYGISSLSPSYGVPSGGTNVTVTGVGFDDFTNYRLPVNITNPTSSPISNSAVNVTLPIYNNTGLVGSWHFDNNSPILNVVDGLIDSSGNGNHGTAYGTPFEYGDEGVAGYSIPFTNTNNRVLVEDDNSLDFGTGDFTVSVWVKPDEISNWDTIFRKGTSSGGNWFYMKYVTGSWELSVASGGFSDDLSFTEEPRTGEWTHAVFVRNHTAGGVDKISLYLNGVHKISETVSTLDIDNGDDLHIGVENSGGYSDHLDGNLDEMRMYNRLLSDSEIQTLYQGSSMYNYWDVQFKNETGEVLNHSMDSDGIFQVEIASIAASSSQMIYAEYGQTMSSPQFSTTPTVSTSLQVVVEAEDANAMNLTISGNFMPSATKLNSTTLQFTSPQLTTGLYDLTMSHGSKSFTLTNGFRIADCLVGNSTMDRWGCPDTDGDGYSDPDPTGVSGPVWNISDGADNCVNIANVNQSDYENDLIGDVCDNDDDEDTVADIDDECQYGALNWTSNGSTDIDSDGCQDAVEDTPLISYPYSTYDFRSNVSNVSLILSNVGTSTINYSISPAIITLNLTFNTNTGEISGIPNSPRITVNYTIWANNSFGSNHTNLTISVGEPVPANIQYPAVNTVFTRGVPIGGGWSPTQTGGIVNSWAIQPLSNLTAVGLSFNTSTGSITGTPASNMSQTPFMVSATNLAGIAYANISITIVEPQAILTPSSLNVFLTRNELMTPITITNTGGNINTWEIYTNGFELQVVGLSFNSGNGTISGTPISNMTITTYTIWANNTGGAIAVNVSITILHPLDQISYPASDYNLTVGSMAVIGPNPIDAGYHTWEISPDLPGGLAMDNATGEISGTPSDNGPIWTYTITAYNDNGSNSTSFTIVIVNPVTDISYPQTHYNKTKGVAFSITPDLNGTEVTHWSLTMSGGGQPPPPSYFSIDAASGVISGTPTGALSNATYTVHATNDNNTATFNLSIWILGDRDGDGTADASDPFPDNSTQWMDSDGDGYGDNQSVGAFEPDSCVDVAGTSDEDRFGCPDTDGDGYSDYDQNWTWMDGADNFTADPSQWADQDGDGRGDNLSGNEPDMFQTNPTQWNDTDGDGYGDNYNWSLTDSWDPSWPGERIIGAYQIDRFPLESSQWNDTDDDGYGDNLSGFHGDVCPSEWGNSSIDRYGCLDHDGDGVSDEEDAFDNDPLKSKDTDGDGIDDTTDYCWEVAGNSTEDRSGCPDSDGDGYSDADSNWSLEEGADAFRYEPTQWSNQDSDDYGDNQNGFQPDSCIEYDGNSTIDRWGCLDTDGDGVSDEDENWTLEDGADAFPNNPSATGDADGDGIDNDVDDCLTIPGDSTGFFSGDSTSGGKKGCPDSDGDGWADSEDEEPDDPQQIIDTTPPPVSTIWDVVDEDDDGSVLLVKLSHSGSDWDELDDPDRPVSIRVRYSTTTISDCSGANVNGPAEDVSESTRPPSVIRLENLTDGQEYHVCLFILDIRGNEFILGPNNATPTRNEEPVYDGRLTNEIAYTGELWSLNLCDYFSDEETECEGLEVSSSSNRFGINQLNKSISWRPTGSDASLTNITFTVCDEKGLCTTSNPINIGVEVQQTSFPTPTNEEDSALLTIYVPIFGETEITLDSILGAVGSAMLGILTVGIAVIRYRRSNTGKKRVSELIREVRVASSASELDNIYDDATKLYTKDRIGTEDYAIIDSHIERRRNNLLKESANVRPEPIEETADVTPPSSAEGEIRDDGYEWFEYPPRSKAWWYRVPDSDSWKRWDD